MAELKTIAKAMLSGSESISPGEKVYVYEKSLQHSGDTAVMMVKLNNERKLLVTGAGRLFDELQGSEQDGYKMCALTHDNRLVINQHFNFTMPQSFGTEIATIGLGDRLGLASPGHIQTIRGRAIKPVLAQQSIRELQLTGRDYREVMDAACFAVFQEGYTGGFGADGDHLKEERDIAMALELGFTMLTLDCSDKIDNTIEQLDEETIASKYDQLDPEKRGYFESTYLDQTFQIGSSDITFGRQSLMKQVLIYGEAIDFMKHIYRTFIQPSKRSLDFEISIDETLTPTAPEAHYFVAQELYRDQVDIYSMAPRFCGEFQKGIDYIGDITQFEQELKVHADIADHFGYKLSIHSGSDKFSVFPLIAKYTKGRFHVKTAGTNWLEAVRTVAKVNPKLYRSMHEYALKHVEEALAYYQVTTDFDAIVPLAQVSDEQLPQYMDDDNARQLIHITYGILLQAADDQGRPRFKDAFFETLKEEEDAYEESLIKHIGKHLDLLGK